MFCFIYTEKKNSWSGRFFFFFQRWNSNVHSSFIIVGMAFAKLAAGYHPKSYIFSRDRHCRVNVEAFDCFKKMETIASNVIAQHTPDLTVNPVPIPILTNLIRLRSIV